jgi:hypothetical protein
MSRIRIVEGTITKKTGGDHYIYSKGNIVFSAGGFITETAQSYIYSDVLVTPPPSMFEDRIINVNGHFYNTDGTFEGKINEPDFEGSIEDVYVCDGKSIQKDKNGNDLLTYNNTKILKENDKNVKYDDFIFSASTVYAESSIGYGVTDKYELFAIANVHKRNKTAYGAYAPEAKNFRKKKNEERNETNMIHAIAAEINVLQNGEDFSNGATQWDGAEQTHLPKDEDSSSNGKFMFKINVMGWDITDELYEKWKLIISSKLALHILMFQKKSMLLIIMAE